MQQYPYDNSYNYSKNLNNIENNNYMKFKQNLVQSELPESIRMKLNDNLNFNDYKGYFVMLSKDQFGSR